MTRTRRKVWGALLQIFGGSLAIVTFAVGVGVGSAVVTNGLVQFILAFIIMLLIMANGVACIWWGSAMYQASQRGFCPRCDYDLHGQVEAGCPECGWMRGG